MLHSVTLNETFFWFRTGVVCINDRRTHLFFFNIFVHQHRISSPLPLNLLGLSATESTAELHGSGSGSGVAGLVAGGRAARAGGASVGAAVLAVSHGLALAAGSWKRMTKIF